VKVVPLLRLIKKQSKVLNDIYSDKKLFVEELSASYIKGVGAEAVILDHDGILSPARAKLPDDTGLRLIDELIEGFGADKVFILSNTRTRRNERFQYFEEVYPDLDYLVANRKPDGEGLEMASRASGVPREKIAMVDDGLTTGILMAVEHGAIPLYAVRRSLDESFSAKLVRLATTVPQIVLVKMSQFFK